MRFSAGEITSDMLALVDTQGYQAGARKIRNFFIKPHGGVANRAGTEFVGVGRGNNLNSAVSNEIRLIPFQFSVNDSYVLELGHRYMRVIRDGGYVLETKNTNDDIGTAIGINTISKNNPALITMDSAHGYAEGQAIRLYGSYREGTSGDIAFNEINEKYFFVAEPTELSFYLKDSYGTFLNTLPYSDHVAGTGSCIKSSLFPVVVDKVEQIEHITFGSEKRTRFKATAHGKANGEWVQVYGAYRYISGTSGSTTPFVEMNNKIGIIADHNDDYFYLKKMDGTYWDYSAYNSPLNTGSFNTLFTKTMPYTGDDLKDLKFVQEADVMILTHPNHPPRKLTRQGHAIWSIQDITFGPAIGKPVNLGIKSTNTRTFVVGTITNTNPATIRFAKLSGSDPIPDIGIIDSGTVGRIKNAVGMTEVNDNVYVLGDIAYEDADEKIFELENTSLEGINATSFGTYTADSAIFLCSSLYRYQVSALDADAKEGRASSFPVVISRPMSAPYDADKTPPKITMTWDAVNNAQSYNLYRQMEVPHGQPSIGSQYGYIGNTTTTQFVDQNILPDFDRNPPKFYDPFKTGLGEDINFPACCAFYQQRLVFAGSYLNPQVMWFSQSGDYYNMDRSENIRDSDSIGARVASGQINRILHIVPMTTLLLLTEGGCFKVSGSASGALTATNIEANPQIYLGSSHISPIPVNADLLYLQTLGTSVFSLVFNVVKDTYEASDISIRAKHLLEQSKLKEWAFASEPHNVIYGVREDGKILMLTYMKDAEVVGWSWGDSLGHSGDDKFESVCTIMEQGESVIYFVVSRKITTDMGSKFYKYIEKMKPRRLIYDGESDVRRGVFLDSSVVYRGDTVYELLGLDHLEGCTVTVLADGNVLEPHIIKNGVLTLEQEATHVIVGLPYVSELQTLPLDSANSGVSGRKKKISEIKVRVKDTRGITANIKDDPETFQEPRYPVDEKGDIIELVTGDLEIQVPIDYTDDGVIFIKQEYPLPVEILGIIMEVTVGN